MLKIIQILIPLIVTPLITTFALAADPKSPAAVAEVWYPKALAKKGNAERGKQAYKLCAACHLPSAAGRPDGLYPQLAGQHAAVLIKQMVDIRTGKRDSPSMYPFIQEIKDPLVLADIAAHIEELCIPTDNGRYEGPDAAQQIAKGKKLYEQQCIKCHGKNGAGNEEKFYPVIAGQHYKYLLRQMTDIRDGRRCNVNPDMVRIIDSYSDEQLVAISAYQARLAMPGAMCEKEAHPHPNSALPLPAAPARGR